MPSGNLLDYLDMVEGFPAVDLSAGANNGDYVNVRDYDRVAVVFISGIGTAGDDPTLTIQQAKDNAGTSVKALNVGTTRAWKKQAVTNLSTTTAWSDASADIQAAPNAHKLLNTDAAEQSLIYWVEFRAADLDVANGFTYVRGTVADVGANAQPGYLFYLLGRAEYADKPANKVSPL